MNKLNVFLLAAGITAAADISTAEAQIAGKDSIDAKKSRLTIGGYGEAVMTRNFYSDSFNRYKTPEKYKDDDSHGRFDLPHVTINLGYDFGHGWTLGTEIEFEHGGTESAVEMEADESGEYEAEIERGGEVALEQFWINKAFWDGKFNIKAGEIIVPVGLCNAYHEPLNFFTVYRPEGESTILPNTWHQVGLSLWGRLKEWRYELQFLSGLNSDQFGSESFVHYGAASPYEFKIANSYAGAVRIDNYSIKGLRIGVSGYIGNSFNNTLKHATASKYDDCKGTLTIGTVDFALNRWNWIVRGNFDWAHLSDADLITAYNNTYPQHTNQDGSPSKHQVVGSDAVSVGIEAGYNIFSQIEKLRGSQKLYLFGHYEYYNSMQNGTYSKTYKWCGKNRVALGFNYHPVKQIVVKGEWSKRFYTSPYNNEPSISLGIAYQGWFL